jgi:lipopolysaccharide biosynthesis glycosyltransferase
MTNTINIAYCIDNNYAQHFAVSLASLLKNSDANCALHIHVLTNGISDDNQNKILSLVSIRDFKIDFITVDENLFTKWPNNWGHVNLMTYYRLLLPHILPYVDKIIYIDTDTIVYGDIADLWSISLTDHDLIAGCVEHLVKPEIPNNIHMQNSPYINAGVMILNCKSLRNYDFLQKCISYVSDNADKIINVDQDIINPVCKGRIKIIQPQFNMNFSNLSRLYKLKYKAELYSHAEFEHAFRNPVIIHYCGSIKPWYYSCRYGWYKEYMKYITLTPWKNYKYPDKTFKNIIKKMLYNFETYINILLYKYKLK